MKIRETFLPFNKPSITATEIAAVTEVLESGWITTGAKCKEFEEEFCRLTSTNYAISLTSATAGMHITLLALGIGEGDEVITPSMTFASTVNMIALLGAKPVFVDIEYGTLNMDARKVEAAITPRTKAIIPVHFAGAPAEMNLITAIAERQGIAVIEDAAHAVGTYYLGKHIGAQSKAAIFSFHPIKNITSGEGGMVVTNDAELERKLRLLRFHGIERDAWKRYGKGGNPEYDIAIPGFKYNLTDIHAALGLAQLRRLEYFNTRRSQLVALYRGGLATVSGIELPESPGYEHRDACHLFIVKVLAMGREAFMARLADYNIGYGLHFSPAHSLSYIKQRFGQDDTLLPETVRAADKIISLPLFPDMSEDDVAYVCSAIREILQ
ncbi:MAG: aminotransferase class I/II-fold pyridoxal phosphate-dependent enzyme [Deltaproteobacteria bacterium]|nr:aminotransferase class I/II-fold pyridoxal phosphate-dependent enzyme [Deltaproteobacteria bacterium]